LFLLLLNFSILKSHELRRKARSIRIRLTELTVYYLLTWAPSQIDSWHGTSDTLV